jgi:hypothetical protein
MMYACVYVCASYTIYIVIIYIIDHEQQRLLELLTNIKDITRACVSGLSVSSFTRLMYAYVYVCA